MLKAAQRLRRTSDIQRTYKAGRSVYNGLLRVVALPTDNPTARATVVVSTNVSKKAVERNRLKRRLRASLRPLLTDIKHPHDIVVLAQRSANQATAATLAAALKRSLTKLHVL